MYIWLTNADDSSVLKVVAVVDADAIMLAVKQPRLCAVALQIVQQDLPKPSSKETTRKHNCSCVADMKTVYMLAESASQKPWTENHGL